MLVLFGASVKRPPSQVRFAGLTFRLHFLEITSDRIRNFRLGSVKTVVSNGASA
jgi:hypothetical protein